MKTVLPLFLNWGITFEKLYEIADQAYRQVFYADKQELEDEIDFRFNVAAEIDSGEYTSHKIEIAQTPVIYGAGQCRDKVLQHRSVRTD